MNSGFIRIANAKTRRVKTSTKLSDFESNCANAVATRYRDKIKRTNNQARPTKLIPFSYPGKGAFDGLVGSIRA